MKQLSTYSKEDVEKYRFQLALVINCTLVSLKIDHHEFSMNFP